MFGWVEGSADRLTLREQAVVQALLANETVDEIAARFRTSAAKIKAHVATIYRKARRQHLNDLMHEYFAREAKWLEQNRIEALRRMLASTGTRKLHLHLLAALRAWTGAGQAFLWEIRDGRGGPRLIGESGINYAVRNNGVVPALAARPVAIVDADAIQAEEWAVVASAEAGALPMQGQAIVLTVAYDGCRWLALLANLPDGHAHPAAVELAQAVVDIARTVATSWTVPWKTMAASVTGPTAMYGSPPEQKPSGNRVGLARHRERIKAPRGATLLRALGRSWAQAMGARRGVGQTHQPPCVSLSDYRPL